MNEMYTGLVCLVLFDARGSGTVESAMVYGILTMCLSFVVLSIAYIPHIFNRPALVDSFCGDVLSIAVHAACISMLSDPLLRHACALNSVCYCIQSRFIGVKSTVNPILLHTMLTIILLLSYIHGPRITDVQQFVIGAVCPHILEFTANILSGLHAVAVTFCSDMGT